MDPEGLSGVRFPGLGIVRYMVDRFIYFEYMMGFIIYEVDVRIR